MRQLKLARRYALALLSFAQDRGLPLIYRQALSLTLEGNPTIEKAPVPLSEFLHAVPPQEVEQVLSIFLELARKEMHLVPVEVISAVPLTEQQLYDIEVRLIRMTRKQLDIRTTVDPSLLGGLRIIVDNTVIDQSIKRKLSDLKKAVYEGVYLR
ncbi:MAG: ATP synthase F1 subunit delta [Oscillospiraceae bacterium]|jgi:F0F1-type ATP synthase delta subunit